MNAAIQRLRAEIDSDRRVFLARVEELRGLDLGRATPATLAQAAVALHHGYGAVESALERLARAIEESSPTGVDRHVALLEAMALDVEGVRPAVLTQESLGLLRRLLAFRHFFRHAYAVPLAAPRLDRLREDMLALAPVLEADLGRLDAHLAHVAAGAS